MLKHAVLALCLGSGLAFTPLRPVGLSRRLRARAAARTLYDKVRENCVGIRGRLHLQPAQEAMPIDSKRMQIRA
jgi:hypothetical protein